MKKLLIGTVVLASTFILVGTVFAAFAPVLKARVDIGNAASEAMVIMSSWGPIEPTTHGGGWGGISSGTCRVTYAPAPGYEDADKSASITFSDNYGLASNSKQRTYILKLRVLDGIANDDFKVYVNGDPLYMYSSDPSTIEFWKVHEIQMPRIPRIQGNTWTVKIEATGGTWWGINTYGQLAVDWVELWME